MGTRESQSRFTSANNFQTFSIRMRVWAIREANFILPKSADPLPRAAKAAKAERCTGEEVN